MCVEFFLKGIADIDPLFVTNKWKPTQIHEHQSTFLWIVCWRTYKKSLIFGGIIKILSDLSSLIGPVSIGYILNYISNVQHHSAQNSNSVLLVSDNLTLQFISAGAFFRNAYVMTIVVLVATFLQSTLSNNFNHLVISEGIHLKTALSVSKEYS